MTPVADPLTASRAGTPGLLDVDSVRAAFPVLHQEIYGRPLAYLDNAASSQKPEPVVEAMSAAYRQYYSNVHRGVHKLSQVATDHFEAARSAVARFIGAAHAEEIVFTRGATEALNLVAHSYGRRFLQAGDEVLVTTIEHHSNIVPWQMLRDEIGITLRVAPVRDDGSIAAEDVTALIGERTRIVAVPHVSNAFGTILPVSSVPAP